MTLSLTRRHLAIFFRDPAAVFFSLLSPLIVFVLYSFFLGALQESNLKSKLPGADPAAVTTFVHSWMFAGVVMIATMTTSLSALTVFVDDRISSRFRDFRAAPLTRFQLISSYVLSSFLISLIMSTIVFVFSQLYLWVADGLVPTARLALTSLAYVLLFCALFSALWCFVVTFIKSSSVFMSVGTIVGTAGGFLCGAFITVGTLPKGVVTVMNSLPLNQAATLMRSTFTKDTAKTLTHGVVQARQQVDTEYGMVLKFATQTVPVWAIVVFFGLLFAVLLGLGIWRIGRRLG